MDGGDQSWSIRSTAGEDRPPTTKSHSEAERKRRERINGHLATLRSLLPNAARADKASLLAEVVRRVRELKRSSAAAAAASGGDDVMVPGEADDVAVEADPGSAELTRVSVCCADRPGLMGELGRAVRAAKGRAVRAEMVTVGGRTKGVLVVEIEGEGGRSALYVALRAVVEKSGGGDGVMVGGEKKRCRGAYSNNHYQRRKQ
ncbi:Transcription factor bHLH30 [Acorus gramineus]|uniref:Transcription factor bHLH30 n=1 Tax=Acorus gramineus TaxID=55184 RepID=A0AAV9BKB8_ACOGR|nr:Transcription factor bHLH30 [Acorus gramineus]